MGELLSVATLQPDNNVQTVDLRIDPKTTLSHIRFNLQFVSNYAYQPSRFAALLAHELLHHLFRHYLTPEDGHLSDVAQDIIINSTVCQTVEGFASLFNDLYDKRTFPSLLLRPGGNFRPYVKLKDTPAAGIYNIVGSLQSTFWPVTYRQSRSGGDPSLDATVKQLSNLKQLLHEARDAAEAAKTDLPAWFELFEPEWWQESLVLGNHEATEDDLDSADENEAAGLRPFLDSLVRDLSAGPGGSLFTEAFKVNRSKGPEELAEALNESLRKDIMLYQEIVEAIVGPELTDTSQVPTHVGRKECFLLANGHYPTSYPTYGPSEDIEAGGSVMIYLDVSGSMGDQSRFLLMLLTGFKNRVASELFQFSTEIVPINFGELVERFEQTGEISISTTGGTDFDPIFDHARKNEYNKILLITDGCASVKQKVNKDWALANKVYTLFTQGHQAEPLTPLSKRTWVLPTLDGES
jgi:hypothetical protein